MNGKLVLALIDIAMVALNCNDNAAPKVVYRLLKDYWNYDEFGILEETNLSPQVSYSPCDRIVAKSCFRSFFLVRRGVL